MEYTDIGHSDEVHLIWVYKDQSVQAVHACSGTHESLWGTEAMQFWRGRFEPETKRLSIAAPADEAHVFSEPPAWLLDLLTQKFGAIEPFYFQGRTGLSMSSRRDSA